MAVSNRAGVRATARTIRAVAGGLLVVAVAVALVGCLGEAGPSTRPASAEPHQTADSTLTLPPVAPSVPPTVDPSAAGGIPTGLEYAHWVGVWRGEEPDQVGTSQVETVLMEDLSFRNSSVNATAGTALFTWGRWDIVTLPDRPVLRFAVEGWEPEEWCGPLGCSPILVPTGQSRYFRFLDADTVVLTSPECTTPDCEVTYRRAR